jgi:hypothetical protein
VIKVEHWKPTAGAKMTLPEEWFKIRGVPSNYRNKEAVSLVSSLVGVAQEVDEDTIDKYDYVRAKIMVLDVSNIPAVAPGLLGKCMYDFHFRLEVQDLEAEKNKASDKLNDDNANQGKERDINFDQFSGQLK